MNYLSICLTDRVIASLYVERLFDVVSMKLYPDTTANYTDVDDVNMVPSACQWQGCRIATDKLRLVDLSVFVEADRPMAEQVLQLNYFMLVFSWFLMLIHCRNTLLGLISQDIIRGAPLTRSAAKSGHDDYRTQYRLGMLNSFRPIDFRNQHWLWILRELYTKVERHVFN